MLCFVVVIYLLLEDKCSSFNSLGPNDAIWRWRSWSTLVQVMAWCLTAPSHYLNQCWLIISKVLRHSSEDIIIRRFEDTNQKKCLSLSQPQCVARPSWDRLSWWHHQMETISALLTDLWCREFTSHQWIPLTKPVMRSFDAFFDLCLNKRLSKQSWGWWFETPSCSLWRYCNDMENWPWQGNRIWNTDTEKASKRFSIYSCFSSCIFQICKWNKILYLLRTDWLATRLNLGYLLSNHDVCSFIGAVYHGIFFMGRFNSLWPSDTIWCHKIMSSLVEMMACCLYSASLSPETIEPLWRNTIIWIKFQIIFKMNAAKFDTSLWAPLS